MSRDYNAGSCVDLYTVNRLPRGTAFVGFVVAPAPIRSSRQQFSQLPICSNGSLSDQT